MLSYLQGSSDLLHECLGLPLSYLCSGVHRPRPCLLRSLLRSPTVSSPPMISTPLCVFPRSLAVRRSLIPSTSLWVSPSLSCLKCSSCLLHVSLESRFPTSSVSCHQGFTDLFHVYLGRFLSLLSGTYRSLSGPFGPIPCRLVVSCPPIIMFPLSPPRRPTGSSLTIITFPWSPTRCPTVSSLTIISAPPWVSRLFFWCQKPSDSIHFSLGLPFTVMH